MAVVVTDVDIHASPSEAEERFNSFCSSLRHSPPGDGEGKEPPKKKRKRSTTFAAPVYQVFQDDYALIASVVLRITPPKTGIRSERSDPYPVVLGPVLRPDSRGSAIADVSPAYDDSIVLPLRLPQFRGGGFLQHAIALQKASDESIAKTSCVFDPNTDENDRYLVRVEIYWKLSHSTMDSQVDAKLIQLLQGCFIKEIPMPCAPSAPEEFYQSVYSPPLHDRVAPQIQNESLRCTLYPFQRRAVKWLLGREGVTFKDGRLVAKPSQKEAGDALPPSFSRATDAQGRICYVSSSIGVVVQDKAVLPDFDARVRGGILAEEMGLGKTVELIALMCLHKRPPATVQISNASTNTVLTPSAATLIITPQHILQQWMNEIEMHAPHLRVFHYRGMSSVHSKESEKDVVDALLRYDVVLTTYHVLSKEIHWAGAAPERKLRHAQTYERRRSPLVMISWWRVCLDEAQMIESGVSQAAIVARLIPRVNAWSVTGTPIKKDARDLWGLLLFLRYEPFATKKVWQRIDQTTFKRIFGTIALRHSKDQVRHELELPPQKRIVITTPFTTIEEQHYAQLLQEMCGALGLNLDGSPAKDDYDPQNPKLIAAMRSWLQRLRQSCLHPQVGSRNRKTLGLGNGPLRTVGEVLEVMIEQNETALRACERDCLMAQILRAHIIAYGSNDPERHTKALRIYQEALEQADILVLECRRELHLESEGVKMNEGLAQPATDAWDSETDSEIEEKDSKQILKIATLKKTLRSLLEVQHTCSFFVGTAYYQMKTDEERVAKDSAEYVRLEDLETKYYDRAKLIRKELLREAHSKAERAMRKVAAKTKAKAWIAVKMIPEVEGFGGIESRKIVDKMAIVSRLLDKQAAQIELWRGNVILRLSRPLVDEDEGQETTGEEYEDSTKVQDELFVYTTALRALIADRNTALTSVSNFRTDQELREASRYAQSDEGHAPKLMREVIEERMKLKPKVEDGSLKLIVSELRALATRLMGHPLDRAKIELKIVERYLNEVQKILTLHSGILAELEKEQELFHRAMNLRVEFYRQLQAISDMVAPYKEEMDEELDVVALHHAMQKENSAANRLAQHRTKRRFLLHLRSESTNQEEARLCVICQSTFELGVLTVCGHQYCKDCIQMWLKEHRTCPVCKRLLHRVDYQDITYKPQQLRAQEEQADNGDPPFNAGSERSSPSSAPVPSIYSNISIETMNRIKAIDLPGSYGTKIDTLARHIIWIREKDPGAKSIIFSQYSDYLAVLSEALTEFKIGNTSIHAKNGVEQFWKNPGIECFLLDAKSDSSGLNLVNATHVFLCEPLINTALELQAIARVHRIGQLRPTMVYMYLVSDTVEEAIYEKSVARRLAHMSRQSASASSSSSRAVSGRSTPALQETMLDKANSLQLQQASINSLLAKSQGGGEIVEQEDLWDCLFGKTRRASETVSTDLQREVDRQLRAEAAENRKEAGHVGL